MLGGLIDQSMDARARVRVRVRVRRRPPFPHSSVKFSPFVLYTCICRRINTVYAVGYDMKPVQYMKGGNFTENRGGGAATRDVADCEGCCGRNAAQIAAANVSWAAHE